MLHSCVVIDGKDMVVLCVNGSRIVDPQSLAIERIQQSV